MRLPFEGEGTLHVYDRLEGSFFGVRYFSEEIQ